jgi:hypothetical protein
MDATGRTDPVDPEARHAAGSGAFEYLMKLAYDLAQDPALRDLKASEWPDSWDKIMRAADALHAAGLAILKERDGPRAPALDLRRLAEIVSALSFEAQQADEAAHKLGSMPGAPIHTEYAEKMRLAATDLASAIGLGKTW